MNIAVIFSPYDSGHYKKRLGLGAVALSESLEKRLLSKGHSVSRKEIVVDSTFPREVTTSFDVIRSISSAVSKAESQGEFPVIFSGNCNASAVGTLSGLKEKPGVIWFDCHGDFNTPETTVGGFLDGMAISIVTGDCWRALAASVPGFVPTAENCVVLVGSRDVDPLEETRLAKSAIQRISPSLLKKNPEALGTVSLPVKKVYLHIDLDVLDADFVKVNEYCEPGGLSPEDLYNAIRAIKRRYAIAAVGFTAYDPTFDPQRKIPEVVSEVVSILTEV